jgi:hypothetical protein
VLENETKLTEETAAAMRDLARTVTSAPPLRLAPRPQPRPSLAPRPGRWRLWAAPLTAMAAVIVLALALVLIKDAAHGQPGRPSPAVGGASVSASPSGSAGATAPATSAPSATAPTGVGPTSSSASTTTPATTPAASTTANPGATFTFVPMQTPTGGEFYSPSGNINCEVDNTADQVEAYCQTGTPARSVVMDATGHYTICTGEQCLGNAGSNTPTLAYGTATGVGPFRCESATDGVTCTADGKGFLISTAGITAVTVAGAGGASG